MDRRQFVTSCAATATVGLAGCAGGDDGNGGTETPDVDSGEIYSGTLGELRDVQVDVVESQSVTVEASDISEVERLQFQVGDGTAFVHTYQFYEEDSGTTNTYEFEDDGQHQLQLNAERHEAPMNEEVEISVSMEVSEP